MSIELAVAQFAPKKGDYARNLERLGTLFAQIDGLNPRPNLLCLPESTMSGYFVEGGVRDVAVTAGTLARDLNEQYRSNVSTPRQLDVALGFYEVWQNKLYNSSLYVTLGGGEPVVRHVHRKVFLPTYGMFDEERFVERGREIRAFDTPLGRVAMLICEDAWHSMAGTIAALDGAQMILLLAAPPARGPWLKDNSNGVPVSVDRWERLSKDIAEEHGVFVVLASLVGSEGGKMFPGASMVHGPKGDLRVRGPLWEEAIVTASLELHDVTRARADTPLVADLQVMMPHLVANVERVEKQVPTELRFDPAQENGKSRMENGRKRETAPILHSPLSQAGMKVVAATNGSAAPIPMAIDGKMTEDWLVAFIRGEMAQRRFTRALVGISGGVDSSVTAYLAAKALGPKNVMGIRMPYKTSSKESLDHAQLVIDALGIDSCTFARRRWAA